MKNEFVLQPNWPAPANVHAFTTLRNSGVIQPPQQQIGCDNFKELFDLPNEPIWLNQVHGATVLSALPENREKDADASFSNQRHQVCVIQTADCLPILLCDKKGTHVAAIHAGWRGLEKNIIAATIKALNLPANELLAWIGPGISQPNFEVGHEVRDAFLQNDAETESAFIPSPNQRWLADLHAIATLQLQKQGVAQIYGEKLCTYADEKNFFSYRREGAGRGRICSVIWKE